MLDNKKENIDNREKEIGNGKEDISNGEKGIDNRKQMVEQSAYMSTMLNDFERAYNEVRINIDDADNIEDGMWLSLISANYRILIIEINWLLVNVPEIWPPLA